MNTSTVEQEAPVIAKEKLFLEGTGVRYRKDGEILQGIYGNPAHGDHHVITLSDGNRLVVSGSEITPNRPLTDEEMIAYLTKDLAEVCAETDRYRKLYEQYSSDVDKIVQALRDEAVERGWCSEYAEFCDSVNSKLSTPHLMPVEEEYEVEVEVTANVRATRTISVMAQSQEEAESMVSDDPHAFFDPEDDALEEVRNSGWDDYDVNVI